jgi:hypothetical protein
MGRKGAKGKGKGKAKAGAKPKAAKDPAAAKAKAEKDAQAKTEHEQRAKEHEQDRAQRQSDREQKQKEHTQAQAEHAQSRTEHAQDRAARQQAQAAKTEAAGPKTKAAGEGESQAKAAASKPAAAPKAAASVAPPEVAAAASALSGGGQITPAQSQQLVTNGLARPQKDGSLVLTSTGLKAAQQQTAKSFLARLTIALLLRCQRLARLGGDHEGRRGAAHRLRRCLNRDAGFAAGHLEGRAIRRRHHRDGRDRRRLAGLYAVGQSARDASAERGWRRDRCQRGGQPLPDRGARHRRSGLEESHHRHLQRVFHRWPVPGCRDYQDRGAPVPAHYQALTDRNIPRRPPCESAGAHYPLQRSRHGRARHRHGGCGYRHHRQSRRSDQGDCAAPAAPQRRRDRRRYGRRRRVHRGYPQCGPGGWDCNHGGGRHRHGA